jgi:TolB-like protein
MKRLFAIFAVILGVGSLAFGQATTAPAVNQPVKVLVIPFKQIGDAGHEWVGAAIHENLITEVSADPTVQAIGMNRPLDDNSPQGAINAAKGAGASLVVFGSFQFAGDQLRVNGRVLETNYGQTIASLSATGAIIDLFKIEDTLSSQVATALPQPPSNVPTVTYGAQQSATPPPAQAQPTQVPYYAGNQPDDSAVAAQQPATTYVYTNPAYAYPAYSYPYYSYPDYSYPYYYGGPVVIFGGRPFYGRPFYGRPGFGFRGGGFRGGFAGGFHGGLAGGGFHGGGGGHGR